MADDTDKPIDLIATDFFSEGTAHHGERAVFDTDCVLLFKSGVKETEFGVLKVSVCAAEVELRGKGCTLPLRDQAFVPDAGSVERVAADIADACQPSGGSGLLRFLKPVADQAAERFALIQGCGNPDNDPARAVWVISDPVWSNAAPARARPLKGKVTSRKADKETNQGKALARAHEDPEQRSNMPLQVEPVIRLQIFVEPQGSDLKDRRAAHEAGEALSANRRAVIAALMGSEDGLELECASIIPDPAEAGR